MPYDMDSIYYCDVTSLSLSIAYTTHKIPHYVLLTDQQWPNFGLKVRGTKQNFRLGVLIKWGSVPPLQKVGVRTPSLPKITPMSTNLVPR